LETPKLQGIFGSYRKLKDFLDTKRRFVNFGSYRKFWKLKDFLDTKRRFVNFGSYRKFWKLKDFWILKGVLLIKGLWGL